MYQMLTACSTLRARSPIRTQSHHTPVIQRAFATPPNILSGHHNLAAHSRPGHHTLRTLATVEAVSGTGSAVHVEILFCCSVGRMITEQK